MALEYHELEISAIEPTAQNAVCVTFQIPAEHRAKFDFVPGQHLTLRHRINDENLRRFYSICTSQAGSQIRIGVRQIEEGRFSGYLNNEAKVGDKIEVLAPRGHFRLAEKSAGKHIIAFAAGSGITPVYSILHKHLLRDPQSPANLVYGNQMTKSIMLCSDLNDLKDQYLDRFQMIHLLSREQQDIEQLNGRIDQKSITKIIESKNGKTNTLLKSTATKSNLSSNLKTQSYQFVHIATHGLVNFKNPKLSALACYSKNEKIDNFLYANEIQFKNINADLVVLSSCESGIGQLVAGEGLIALNRSFIYSGAKNVMFSLWKVSDKYSSELMIDFYKNYFQNPSYTSALRQAKLKMLANPTSAQPKYWSPFVLMGE